MRYLSLFTGIGGFEKGIEQAYDNIHDRHEKQGRAAYLRGDEHIASGEHVQGTPTCVGFSEIDKYAIQTYQKHYPNHKNYGDITKIDENELPDFDLLVGGFPCQSFSIAGKRGGFADTRGTLFFDIARILNHKKPNLLLLENVKGLLSHDEGRTFATIIRTLDELGYDLQWQVLNSKDFGVPQNRERVIIVGHLRGTPRPQVFPIGDDGKLSNQPNGSDERWSQAEISHTIRRSNVKADQVFIRQVNNPIHSNDRVYDTEGISPTLNTMQGGNRQPFVTVPVLTPDRLEKRQNGRRFKEDGDPSFTLTAQDKHGIFDGVKIRRLTPLECERLQGFPDNWTEYGAMKATEYMMREKKHIGKIENTFSNQYVLTKISDTQRYKQCGNAVTVNVIQAVMELLLSTSNK